MKTFDETCADPDFQRQLERARAGWMSGVPRAEQPDLSVEGLRGSLLARLLGALGGQPKSD